MNRTVVVPGRTTGKQTSQRLGGSAILSRPHRPTPVIPADSTPKPQKKHHAVLLSATKTPKPPVKHDRKHSPYDHKSDDAETTNVCSWFPVPLRLPVKKHDHDVGNIVPATTPFAGMTLAIGNASSWLGEAFAGLGVVVANALWLEQDTNTELHRLTKDMDEFNNGLERCVDGMEELENEYKAFNKDMAECFIQTNNTILDIFDQLREHREREEMSDAGSGSGSGGLQSSS
mmetsp:Transcript_36131/g.79108  ORF Transcript_36131/g.79108 Transcript_36131/m.79108 type:complete len:231 (-) Transcript_36131:21-713(-)|eukprot:CAMPEP_0178619670 /NCGR_PEP_ID=MMETSP0698-20121128/4885_1 /TAXON_ID=265572 /ORGANISM="Extubocellulus spinifer, Strain CCMP396" /LENGTH=230 /DNA_ID=CAMNT_0020258615 /DNA_START=422 /DNA_END=1117 /DNA_ORIENTATION=-